VTPAAPGVDTRAGPMAVRAAAAPTGVLPPRVCLDCGAPLSGRYCPACGQKDEPLKRNLGDLALEFVQHPLIDTKLWRSLVPLLLRPGALTAEYLAGRRTRYVRPLKLYLTISVTFFALLALLIPQEKYINFQSDSPQPEASTAAPSPASRQTVGVALKPSKLHLPIQWLDDRFQRNSEALDGPQSAALRTSVSNRIAGFIPKLVFVLLPLAAVLFKLFWWKRYFVEHLVFSLHLHSFAFAAALVIFLHWTPVTVVVVAWGVVYVALAFRRVYGQGWVKTLAKLLGVWLSYTVLYAGVLALAMLTAVVVG
jgi:hypothetical protein